MATNYWPQAPRSRPPPPPGPYPNFRRFTHLSGSVVSSSRDRPLRLALIASLYMMATPHSCALSSLVVYCRTSSLTLRYVASSIFLNDLCQIPPACSSHSSHAGRGASALWVLMYLSRDCPFLHHLQNT